MLLHHNYDPQEMVQRLNESVYKAAEEAPSREMRQTIKVDVTAKLIAQFTDEQNQKEAILKKEFAVEKAAMKKTISKVQKASKKIWKFISSQAVGNS